MGARKLRKKCNKKKFNSRPKGKKVGGDASALSCTRLPTYGDVFRLFYALSSVYSATAVNWLSTITSAIASDLDIIWGALLPGIALMSPK